MNRNPDSWEGWYWGAEHVWGFHLHNGNCDAARPAGRHDAELRALDLLVI